jgi:hypothetical protein
MSVTCKIDVGGTKRWYKNGERHRDGDHPAIERADGDKHWYKYGTEYSHKQITDYYLQLEPFARYIIGKFRLNRLKQVRWIQGELLCRPPRGNFPGGADYHKMVDYFSKL